MVTVLFPGNNLLKVKEGRWSGAAENSDLRLTDVLNEIRHSLFGISAISPFRDREIADWVCQIYPTAEIVEDDGVLSTRAI